MPVALLHVAAFAMGYFICKGLGFNEKTSRTVSIETGAAPPAVMCSKTHAPSPPKLAVKHAPRIICMQLLGFDGEPSHTWPPVTDL